MDPLEQVAGPRHVVEAVRRIDRLDPLDGYQREMVTTITAMGSE